jgi:two-component sensor histidine kinase
MHGFYEILEYVLNLSIFSELTMVAMDSYVVKDAKYQQNKAEKESENRVQDIARSVEELFELVSVSLEGNDINRVCQAHVEVAFYEEFLTHFKEIVKLISSV